jgi:hypothetical protein
MKNLALMAFVLVCGVLAGFALGQRRHDNIVEDYYKQVVANLEQQVIDREDQISYIKQQCKQIIQNTTCPEGN